MAGTDPDRDANVSTLAVNPPNDDESKSTIVAAPMEVHRMNRLSLISFVHLMCVANVRRP